MLDKKKKKQILMLAVFKLWMLDVIKSKIIVLNSGSLSKKH